MVRKQGPECPRCACPDTEVIGERVVFGQRRERCECDFCGHVFTAGGLNGDGGDGAARHESADQAMPEEEEPLPRGVAYNSAPPRCICPSCSARNPQVTRTTKEQGGKITRYHRCECGLKFKSVEEAAHG